MSARIPMPPVKRPTEGPRVVELAGVVPGKITRPSWDLLRAPLDKVVQQYRGKR